MDFTKEFKVKGNTFNSFNDDTDARIQNMIEYCPDIIEMINEYFIPKQHLLDHWGYSLK